MLSEKISAAKSEFDNLDIITGRLFTTGSIGFGLENSELFDLSKEGRAISEEIPRIGSMIGGELLTEEDVLHALQNVSERMRVLLRELSQS